MVRKYGVFLSNRGYSMVELMVTMAILAIIATPLAGYFIVGAHNNRLAREQMEAAHLAQQVMEDWKAAPMIGSLAPGDSVSGPFTVSRQAVIVDRPGADQITYGVAQPPVVPGSEAPAPVQRDIENYQYSAVGALTGPADVVITNTATPGTYQLTVGGISQNVPEDFTLNMSVSAVDTHNNQIVFSGAGLFITQTVNYLPGAEPVRVVFTMNAPARITVDASSTGPAADVYVYQGFDSIAGSNFPDNITVNPVSPDIRVYENLNLTPGPGAGFDPVRVYQLTVTVTRGGNPLVQLVSYKRIE